VATTTGGHLLPDLVTVEPRTRVASLSEKAYYLLRDRLVTLEIPPGATIDERGLQDQLGLGRTPIREALRRLADARLVEVVPRRGIFASHVDLGDLRAISEVRARLEGYAAGLAARRVRADELAEADGLLTELAAGPTGQRELIRLDQRVHRFVHRATHNGFLAATLEEYYVHSLRLWFLVLDRLPHLEHAVAEHVELLAAVRDRDPGAAERVASRHVVDFEDKIRSAL